MNLSRIRCRWHPIAGFLTPLGVLIHPSIAVIAFAGFMLYQLYQDRNNARNKGREADSHIDIAEYLYGLFAAIPVMIIARYLIW